MTPDTLESAAAERPRLGTLLTRLDEILRQLDRDDMDLEDQLALYREACGHMGAARSILNETRAEIEFLTSEEEETADWSDED